MRWRTPFCRRCTPTPANQRSRRNSRRRHSTCATGSAIASGSSFPGATTATRYRPGTRRSSSRDRGQRHIRERRSPSTRSAVALIRLGQFEQSVEPLREAIRLDPQFVPAYGNLAASLLAVNRLDEARATLKMAADRKLDFIGASRLSYLLAFVQGDTETMERELEASIGLRQTNSAFGWQAHASAADGARESGARPVPPRHSDVASRRLHRSRGAAHHGRCRDACDRRAMRRRCRRGIRGPSPGQGQRDARTCRPCLRAVRRPQRGREARERIGNAVSGGDVDHQSVDSRHRGGCGPSPGRASACRRAARTGQAVRSRALWGILASVPSRSGVPAAEERTRPRRASSNPSWTIREKSRRRCCMRSRISAWPGRRR